MNNKEEILKNKEEDLKKKEEALKKMEEELQKKKEAIEKEEAAINNELHLDEKFRPEEIDAFDDDEMRVIMTGINAASVKFSELSDNMLRPRERRRLIGMGIRNYGFTQKVRELIVTNPRFVQMFNGSSLINCITNIDYCRNLIVDLDGFERRVRDSMLTYSDEAFSMALMFYHTVQEMARRGDGDARIILQMLQPFFKPRNRRNSKTAEPTEKQIERDVRALLRGEKDGEIIVKGKAKRTEAAEHSVMDNTHKPNAENFTETVHGVICNECNANNPLHAKFCINCGKVLVTV